jgi:hypothetical protein
MEDLDGFHRLDGNSLYSVYVTLDSGLLVGAECRSEEKGNRMVCGAMFTLGIGLRFRTVPVPPKPLVSNN